MALIAAVVMGTGTASAAPTCTFSGGSAHVDVPGAGDTVVVAVGNGSEDGKILFGATAAVLSACGSATVSNTDTVTVTGASGTQILRIALASGPFEPGATVEADGTSEIEFDVDLGAGTDRVIVAGGEEANSFVAGSDGVNVNAGESPDDVDVVMTNVERLGLEGAKGDDSLTVGGGEGTGAATEGISVTLSGGDDDDHLTGGPGNDWLGGGSGDDVLDGADGVDTAAYSGASSGVVVDLQAGTATGGDGSDTVSGIENVTGSDFADTLVGDAADNLLNGRAGDDTIDGSAGTDAASYSAAASGVQVDLRAGTASGGDGSDSLTGIENLVGSAFDDALSGDGAGNQLLGGDGDDSLSGRGGDDRVIGGDGSDVLRGGAGEDLAVGQAGDDVARGGPSDDVLVGGGGDDWLAGGPGNDFLRGGPAVDRCRGGGGTNAVRSCEV